MDREADEDQGRRDADRSRVGNVGVGDDEVADLDDTGPEPTENAGVDDV